MYYQYDFEPSRQERSDMTLASIMPGDFYEDCDYHPVLCTEADGDDIAGISLIDGSAPRSCSIEHCGVKRLSREEAVKLHLIWRQLFPGRFDNSGPWKFYKQYKTPIFELANSEKLFELALSMFEGVPESFDTLLISLELLVDALEAKKLWEFDEEDEGAWRYQALAGFILLQGYCNGYFTINIERSSPITTFGITEVGRECLIGLMQKHI